MLYSFELINGKKYAVDAINYTAASSYFQSAKPTLAKPPCWAKWNGEYYDAGGIKYYPIEMPSAWDGEDVLTYEVLGYAADSLEAESLNQLLYNKSWELQKILLDIKGDE